MPKITEVCRSFSKTLQEEPYSPISIFSSYKGELDGSETPEEIKKFSDSLYNLAEEKVAREEAKELMKEKIVGEIDEDIMNHYKDNSEVEGSHTSGYDEAMDR